MEKGWLLSMRSELERPDLAPPNPNVEFVINFLSQSARRLVLDPISLELARLGNLLKDLGIASDIKTNDED